MKKCPQCGTILEESKKKCYMCGAELQKTSHEGFGDTFNEQIGTTVSNNQDSVYNSIKNLVSGSPSGGNNDINLTGSVTTPELTTDINVDTTGTKYDNRTAIEKIFSTDSRYKNNDDFDAKPVENQNAYYETPTTAETLTNQSQEVHSKKSFINKEAINKKVKEKPEVALGGNIAKQEKEKQEKRSRANTIFNIGSVVFFIAAVIFLYFKFVAPKKVETKQDFAGLSYEISKDFNFEGESGPSRYYTYGSACALRINHGTTVDANGFLDNYFKTVEKSNPNSLNKKAQISVNGNKWTEISVMDFEENAAAANGYAEVLKYKYVTIVHKGNYYDIVFANDKDDNKCAAMFDHFFNSLELE